MTTEETLYVIMVRRQQSVAAVHVSTRETAVAADNHDYRSALIRADSVIVEARRLRQRVEREKLAYERQQEDAARESA